jgi:hypothetical protein
MEAAFVEVSLCFLVKIKARTVDKPSMIKGLREITNTWLSVLVENFTQKNGDNVVIDLGEVDCSGLTPAQTKALIRGIICDKKFIKEFEK